MSRLQRTRRRTAAVALVPVLALGGTLAATPASAATAKARAGASFRLVDIPMRDGVILKADVFTPASGAGPRGRFPVVVQPASWGQNDKEYVAQGKQLADAGYVAVTYTVRGFWRSGGQIDVAGPTDVGDISQVIDWALANTPADPDRIGMVGLSLGGGLTLMGAAFDPRIKAVASLSGWGDLADSLYSGQTRHLGAATMLAGIQLPTGRQSPEFARMLGDLYADRDLPEVVEWARKRSPVTYVDRINANGTAVFMANAWGDSIFNPSEVADFYQRLTGPKHLELRPGDHATQELTSLLGLPNATWSSARGWLDQYLKGAPGHRKPVELTVRPGGSRESYPDWQSVGSRTEHLPLGDGTLGGAGATDWRMAVVGGTDSGADSGVVELSGLLDQVADHQPTVIVPLLPRAAAAVWQSERYETAQHLRGAVRLHVTVESSTAQGTVFAYLYDEDAFGVGRLISHAPQSWSGRQPGEAIPLDVTLFATAYDLPAGHRLALVLDTKDPMYGGRSPLGSRVSFSGPAELAVPLR